MNGGTIPRVIESEDEKDKIIAATMMILSIPLRRTDGILIVTGEGEIERVYHGIELWKKDREGFLLVTGDSEETEKSLGGITKKMITDLCQVEESSHPRIFKQENARHTLDQAIWVSGLIEKLGIKSLVIVTALYHMPRTFLTFLKTFQKNGQKIILIPSSALPISLEYNYLRIFAEIARIVKYQEKGDVATVQELYEHLQWQLSQL